MRAKNFILLLLLFCCGVAQAQNLVPNPSFEDTISCSNYADNITDALNWSSYRASPDYFNTCANNNAWIVGSPKNFAGHQVALDGNSYAGIITHTSNLFSYSYREIIGVKLVTPLTKGVKYFVSAFFSAADTVGNDCATNKLGFRFSTDPYSIFDPVSIDNFSHVHSDLIIENKEEWTRINGSFMSDSIYEYMMIGNFYDEANTDTAIGNHPGQYVGYYYVDAVCVSTDSLYSLNWTILNKLNIHSNQISISPNPANEFITIRNAPTKTSYSIINTLGQVIHQGILNTNRIETHNISDGIYFLAINNLITIKIIIHH